MTPPSASSERVPERSTTGPSQQRNAEDAAADGPASNLVTHRKPHKTARSQTRPRQEAPNYREERAAYWNGRGYDRGSRPRIYARSLIRRERLLGLVRLSCGRWRAPRPRSLKRGVAPPVS